MQEQPLQADLLAQAPVDVRIAVLVVAGHRITDVLRVDPIYVTRRVREPREECYDTEVRGSSSRYDNTAAGTIVGAIIGGAVGNQVGKGNGRKAATVAGANPIPVPLTLSGNGWTMDIERLEDSITPKTRAIFLNSPCNPTGWTADVATLQSVLDLARRKGLWIIADEIYSLFYYDGTRAPSFLDIMAPEDRILFVNTFSKNWAMTGWRIGWLRVHPSLNPTLENLIQYSTSGVAQFMQRGAVAALDLGDDFIVSQVERAHQARDLVCRIVGASGRARFAVPQGAFYLFFSVEGLDDSMAAAVEIIDKANVGLAPGTAFGAGGDGYLRLCFHRRLDQVEEASMRVAQWLESR